VSSIKHNILIAALHGALLSRATVLELGVGNGGTTACMMSLLPGLKYIIANIPPGLFLSSINLRELFPERRVTVAVNASTSDELQRQIRDNDLIFVFPNQIRLMTDQSVDLFLGVGCLHEVTKATIEDYFSQIDRSALNFYMKVWSSVRGRFDLHYLTRDDYPVRPHWVRVFDDPCVYPSNYSEMGWRIPSASAADRSGTAS
jgi:hypothetical protein